MIKLIRSDSIIIKKNDLIHDIDKFKKQIRTNSNIVSVLVNDSETVLLDKENSYLNIFNKQNNFVRNVGSRLGYSSDKTKRRIGFEFPEDLILCGDKIIISDSGNNQLVLLTKKYNYINTIKLPDSPFKFIYCKDDLLIVSDYFRSVFFISIKFGYIGKLLLNQFVDFYTVRIENDKAIVVDELGDIFDIIIETTDIIEIAERCNNKKILMEMFLEDNKKDNRDNLRALVENDDRLILKYIKRTDDDYFNIKISVYINIKIDTIFNNDQELIKSIEKLSLEFFFIYKILNTKGDQEAGNLIKEQRIFKIFELIKLRREKFEELLFIKNAIINRKPLISLFDTALGKRKSEVEKNINIVFSKIKLEKDKLDDEDLVNVISEYWLLYDEMKMLFPDLRNDSLKINLLNRMFLNNILKDFYFNVALLYLDSSELEKFYSYAEKELFLYSDKLSIMFRYVDILISQQNYEKALKVLSRNIDKNKEWMNYRYYKIYKAKNEPEKAFFFLKKELELFPYKSELIPELLSFNMLKKDEIANIISGLENNDEQIIDSNFNTAMSLFEVGEEEKGEIFLDKELDLFPENRKAVLLKMRLFLKKIPNISYQKGINNFQVLMNYLKTISDELNIELINFFSVLNFVPLHSDIIKQLQSLDWQYLPESFGRQIDIYMSFHKNIKRERLEIPVEKFDNEIYLSSISCSSIALDHFLSEAKMLIEKKEIDKGFDIITTILKYNPGNKDIFEYLDSIETCQ